MNAVAALAIKAFAGKDPILGPVKIEATFRFKRPANHYGTGKNARILKAWAPTLHTTKPDPDKLCRAILDSLTNVAYRDDCQVAVLIANKVYAPEGESEGVKIAIMVPDNQTTYEEKR
jgi:Holliday junction resolvase RusA-like endonuclease